MSVHIALLRAINVAGKRMVSMAELRAMIESLGFTARTLLQSGNIVLGGGKLAGAKLEALLESETEQRIGLATEYFVRSALEWDGLVADNPFPAEARADPGHLVVLALKEAPTPAAVRLLQEAIRGRERVAAAGKQLYAVYPDGIGRSKLTIGVIEKMLATRGTGRNWNTVLKLAAAAREMAGA